MLCGGSGVGLLISELIWRCSSEDELLSVRIRVWRANFSCWDYWRAKSYCGSSIPIQRDCIAILILKNYAPIAVHIAIGGIEKIMSSVETLDQLMVEDRANCKM